MTTIPSDTLRIRLANGDVVDWTPEQVVAYTEPWQVVLNEQDERDWHEVYKRLQAAIFERSDRGEG